jgi:hypothetical protein
LNVSKSGTSLSVGPRGAKITIGKKGVYANVGIPGTGLYARQKISGARNTTYKKLKRQKENEAINANPLRFLVIFVSLFLSVILPTLGNASWWWFPLLSIGGIIIGLCIPDPKEKDSVNIVNEEPLSNDVVEKKDEKITSKLKEEDVSKLENIIKLLNFDLYFLEAARLVISTQQGSTSAIQRRFNIGYNRAGRIIDQLEQVGVVGIATGSAPRSVLLSDENTLLEIISNLDIEKLKKPIQTEPFAESNHLEECSRLIGLGINLEKERMIDEAINVYEKAIIPQLPVKHPYERLAILYRKRKDYVNEIRVLTTAISVFMKENERRSGIVCDKDGSLHDMVMQALETNESIRYEDGKWAFVQYDVMEFITRLEKAKKLLNNQNN